MSPRGEASGPPGSVSPRVAGLALMALSMVVGVVSAVFISHREWGIPAAIVLAVASVGVLAGLLLAQRKSWADKTWPPGGDRRVGADEQRRQLRISGAFLIAIGLAAAAGFAFVPSVGTASGIRAGVMVLLAVGFGVFLLVAGSGAVRPAITAAERPEHVSTEEEGDWLRLGLERPRSGFGNLTATASVVQVLQIPTIIVVLVPFLFRIEPWAAILVVAAGIGAVVVALTIRSRRRQTPWATRDGAALRQGRREIEARAVTSVSILAMPWAADATERSLSMTMHATDNFRAVIVLRDRGRLALSERATALLGEVVSRSSIEMPRDKEDSTGRFSKVLYPLHLTKAETQSLISDPPGDGEPLPVVSPLP